VGVGVSVWVGVAVGGKGSGVGNKVQLENNHAVSKIIALIKAL
jgi:hypothetical protein